MTTTTHDEMSTYYTPTEAKRLANRALERLHGDRLTPGLLRRVELDHQIALEGIEAAMDEVWDDAAALLRLTTELLDYMDCFN